MEVKYFPETWASFAGLHAAISQTIRHPFLQLCVVQPNIHSNVSIHCTLSSTINISEPIEEHGQSLTHASIPLRFQPTELICSQTTTYSSSSSSSIGENGFGMETVKRKLEESLQQVCVFVSLH
jgi:hypothetical protein